MSRHRFYIAESPDTSRSVEITGERAHYLQRVLRLRVGASLTVFSDGSPDFAATITSIKKNAVVLELNDSQANDTESGLDLRLIQGLSRGERMDIIVQKATELGARRVSPVHTEFSVVRLDAERAPRRLAHWQKIARGACEQCGRNSLPTIDLPAPLAECIGAPAGDRLRLVLLPGANRTLDQLPDTASQVDLLVGPEGGFSSQEASDAVDAGFIAVTLGPRILRAETAALAAITLVQSKWGDLQA